VDYEETTEHFGCTCFDLFHIICLSYYPSTEKERQLPDFEDLIHCSLIVQQWRGQILPEFWTKYFWLDLEFYKKDYWKNFYESSFWKRAVIGIKYLIKRGQPQDGIFDCICIGRKDRKRLLSILSIFISNNLELFDKANDAANFDFNVNVNDRFIVEDSYEDYTLGFNYDTSDLSPDNELIYTQIFFKDLKFSKRVKSALKYIFCKFSDQMYFELNTQDVVSLQKLIERSEDFKKDGR
jgi:hypothetical protein